MEEYEIKQIKELMKIREILCGVTIIHDINFKDDKEKYCFRPIKNTSRQDCYKALYEINEIAGKIKWY